MLEIKNLVKKYVSKKGTVVKALDDVSIRFPSKGMVFILGKSGSGKSTLLNVMGGLDVPDSGEIIIQNKSSRNFNQNDFDCYRNTYLGFVFQEYNLLEDFNVEENISLALELQKKTLNPFELSAILDKVGLRGLGKRKVSELSGGQKQRVAIARALVKKPEIIFADEPSGALDSNTGRQIFDTLKTLSEEKLVVIISHDRDFAEYYGDRIIELRDGKVYSDLTKSMGKYPDKGIIELGNGVVKIAKGRKLSSSDVQRINDIIARNNEDMYISYNTIFNETISDVIGDDSNAVSFNKTNEGLLFSDDSHFEPIKSKLSGIKCIKLSLSMIRHKPIRLLITVLLCFISFTMFAITSIFATYNMISSMTSTVLKQNNAYIPISKAYNSMPENESNVFNYQPILMNDSEVSAVSKKLKSVSEENKDPTLIKVYGTSPSSTYISAPIGDTEINTYYYTPGIEGLVNADDVPKRYQIITGGKPTQFGEIAVTKNFFETIRDHGKIFFDTSTNNIIKRGIENPADLLGLPLYQEGVTFFICGVYDTNFDKTPYAALTNAEEVSNNTDKYRELISSFEYQNKYSFHSMGIVASSTIDLLVENQKNSITSGSLSSFCFHTRYVYRGDAVSFTTYDAFDPNSSPVEVIKNIAEKQEIVKDNSTSYISSFRYLSMIQNGGFLAFASSSDSLTINVMDPNVVDLFKQEPDESTFPFTFRYSNILNDLKTNVMMIMSAKYFDKDPNQTSFIYSYVTDLEKGKETPTYANKPITINNQQYSQKEVYDEAKTLYNNFLELLLTGTCSDIQFAQLNLSPIFRNEFSTLYLRFESESLEENNIMGNVVSTNGYNHGKETYLGGIIRKLDENTIYLNEELANDFFTKTTRQPYKFVLYDNSKNDEGVIKSLLSSTYTKVNYRHANFITDNYTFDAFSSVDDFVGGLSRIFLIVGGVLGAFAIILFSNFISTSINDKQADIGILRALGSRGTDIFKLFFIESFIVALLCTILSIAMTFAGTFALNITFSNIASTTLTIFTPGIIHISIIIGLSFLVALVSSFIPVRRIASKKPVDAIRKVV